MSSEVPPIARIRLARSRRRLLALPLILILIGAAAAAGAWRADGWITFALAIGGALVMLGGLAIAVVLLSVRLEVTEGGIKLRWRGGERTYVLARGAVTRVVIRGRSASRLRPSLGAFGWALGSARLRNNETVDVVVLDAARTAIVVPCEQRRLAIAVANEQQLLDAVATAARARQRLEDLAKRAQVMVAAAVATPSVDMGRDAMPTGLTGIERARLAAERAAAERAAAERAAAEAEALRRAEAERVAAATASAVAAHQAPAAEALPARLRPGRRVVPRPGARAAAIVVPVLVAGAVWGVITLREQAGIAEPDRLRLAVLVLVLAGPGAAVGALMARIWWPRLVGVVAVTALCALLVAGQALLLR